MKENSFSIPAFHLPETSREGVTPEECGVGSILWIKKMPEDADIRLYRGADITATIEGHPALVIADQTPCKDHVQICIVSHPATFVARLDKTSVLLTLPRSRA